MWAIVAVADSDQVLDEPARAIGVVADDQIAIDVGQRAIDQNQRKTASQQRRDAGPRTIARRRQQKPFDAMRDEILDILALQAQIALAVAEKNAIAGLARRDLGAAHDGREERD